MEEGAIVSQVPNPARQTRYPHIDWDTHADMARITGNPVLAAKNIRNSTVKSVRQYTRPAFRSAQGRIVVHLRDSYVGEDGERYGDVYLEWVPTTPAPSTRKKAK